MSTEQPWLMVFTDLDGSLLDHYSYSHRAALPVLRQLQRRAVPVIPVTSKTRAELAPLREQLGSAEPFIVENGAAVFVPVDYFKEQPSQTRLLEGFWVREFAEPRQRWIELLWQLVAEFPDAFDFFAGAGAEGIAAMTGLTRSQAELANQRDYSEPVRWRGSEEQLPRFMARLQSAGATVLQGGRFMSVGGDCDKGRALVWLREQYRRNVAPRRVADLAIGDSANDIAMLEAADHALLIRSPEHPFPQLQRQQGVITSRAYGPEGWAEGVSVWLHRCDTQQGS